MAHAPRRELAIQIDGAPPGAGTAVDPGRVRRLRDGLVAAGVTRCAAFVDIRDVATCRDELESWLDAGYSLGCRVDARATSDAGPAGILAAAEECAGALARLGAFPHGGAPRWLRSRGLDPAAAARLRALAGSAGFRVAPPGLDLCDHQFELLLGDAVRLRRAWRTQEICDRFIGTGVRAALARLRRAEAPLAVCCGFGEVAARCLPAIAAALLDAGVEIGPLEIAECEHREAGLRSRDRLARSLAAASLRCGLFRQRQLGPRWPRPAPR